MKGTSLGTITDEKGRYELDLSPGTYVVVFRTVGLKTETCEVIVGEDQKVELSVTLAEDILGLDQVVVTASRNRENRKEAPVIVTVTDTKVFEATQSISLSEGLNYQPGLRVETNCQNCGFAQVRINGLGGAYSQILIDSRPIFSALNGVYGLDQIPTNGIERIEVVRGGGSALYGSNAIAGTINVITREPLENSFVVGGNLGLINGREPDRTLTVNASLISKNFMNGLSIYGMLRDRNPYDHNGDGFTEITTLQNQTLGFKGYHKPNSRSKVTLDFHAIHEFRRGGDQLDLQPFESELTEQIDSDVVGGGLTYEGYSNDLKHRYSFYGTGQLSENDNYYGGGEDLVEQEGEVRGFGDSRDETWVLGGQYAYDFDRFLNGTGTFTGGIEYRYNHATDAKPGFNAFVDQIARVYGIYAQQQWRIDNKWQLLLGLRGDFHNLTEETVNLNPRVNILYNLKENIQLRASYAKGFRAPQFFTEDLHSSLAAGEVSFVRFVPGLKSENSHSFILSADWSLVSDTSEAGITLEGFYTRLQDAFILEQATPEELEELGIEAVEGQFIYLKKNSSGANVYGINLEAKYAPSREWVMQLGGTLQQGLFDEPVQWSDDPSISLEKADRFFKSPNIYGNFVVTFAPKPAFQNNLSGVFTGPMYVPHIAGFIEQDTLERTPSFFELNWKSSYTFSLDNSLKLQIYGGIQNIFNSYQEDFDLGPLRDANYIYGPSRPRTYFIGLKIGDGL